MEGEVVTIETAQADGKGLPEGGEALVQGTAIAPQGEVSGNMEMMVMDALDPTLLQMKTEVLEGGGTVTVTGGDEGQIITLQVCVKQFKIMWDCQCFEVKCFVAFDQVKNVVFFCLGGEYGGAGRSCTGSWSASAGAGTCHNSNCRWAPGNLC